MWPFVVEVLEALDLGENDRANPPEAFISARISWLFASVILFSKSNPCTGMDRPREFQEVKGKGKGHPCTSTEALYWPYGP